MTKSLLLHIESVLKNDVVVNWSGGPDSTGLIFLLLKNYSCNVYPIFINRGQKNYEFEKAAVNQHVPIFSKYEKFHKYVEVTIMSPPKEFRTFSFDAQYALRNSDIINQSVRLAMNLGLRTVLLATFEHENLHGDGSMNYLAAKTEEVKCGIAINDFLICSPYHNPHFPQSKANLIRDCYDAGLNLSSTRSCYEPTQLHCGECKACTNRHAAFAECLVEDRTKYVKTPSITFGSRPEKCTN